MARLFLKEAALVQSLRRETNRTQEIIQNKELQLKKEDYRLTRNKIVDLNISEAKDQMRGALVGLFRIQVILSLVSNYWPPNWHLQALYKIPLDQMVQGNISSHPRLEHRVAVRGLDRSEVNLNLEFEY